MVGFEARRRFFRDVIGNFVQRHSHSQPRGDFAMGKPVALLASAELRDTRGFISMTTMRPFSGFTANCTFEPPVSTPDLRG